MPTYFALDAYNPLLSLVVGLLYLAGVTTVGYGATRAVRFGVPGAWQWMLSMVVGFQVVSLLLYMMAAAFLTTPMVLKFVAAALMATGALSIALVAVPQWRLRKKAWGGEPLETADRLWIVVLAVLVLMAFIGALAPVSKADELRYHMLLADRILADGGFRFHLEPWPGSIIPHMAFQLAGLPLHAIAQPFAHATVAFYVAVSFFVFAYVLLRELEVPRALILMAMAACWAGLYPIVWWASPASHAFGDVCGALVFLLIGLRGRLVPTWRGATWYVALSIFALGMVLSKASLLPLAALVLMSGAFSLFLDVTTRQTAIGAIVLGALPWLVLYMPWLAITHAYSGSPWGPFLAGKFGPSVYDLKELEDRLNASRQINQVWTLKGFLMGDNLYVSFPCWLLSLPVFFTSLLPGRDRAAVGALLLAQAVIVVLTLPPEVRFLGGMRFAIILLSLLPLAAYATTLASSYRLALHVGVAALLLPWMGLTGYYARLFVPPVVGLTNARGFLMPLTYHLADYDGVDSLLPADARILTVETWNNSVLYPRPVYLDARDVPATGRPYLMFAGPMNDKVRRGIQGFTPGAMVYHNPHSLFFVGRNPFAKPEYNELTVMELQREP